MEGAEPAENPEHGGENVSEKMSRLTAAGLLPGGGFFKQTCLMGTPRMALGSPLPSAAFFSESRFCNKTQQQSFDQKELRKDQKGVSGGTMDRGGEREVRQGWERLTLKREGRLGMFFREREVRLPPASL